MMRRGYVLGSLGLAALAAGVWLLPLTSAEPRGEKAGESSKSPSAGQLPIAQVVLFSSGVGYFQREGSVEGSQRIDLTFPVQDINDLIKSLTLRDLDGGHVSAVSYDSNVPVERTLQSFAINLTGNPSFGAILNQARGEKVEVVLQQATATQPGTLNGSIVGVEKKQQQVEKAVVEVECLNLWCADGMRSVKLSDVQRIRFLNAMMESEFRKALETLALGHDTQKKSVSIHFAGQGKRQVKVGYVIENPLWKTSYRLVLPSLKDEKKQGEVKEKKPYLQGWAVVENTTDEDWNGVRMALISGRPISFQMNLYDSLFIKRPVVEPELFASLRPPTYSGAILDNRVEELKAVKKVQELAKSQEKASRQLDRAKSEPMADQLDRLEKKMDDLDLRQGVQSAATAEKLGDYFQYAIDHAVSLPRQKSALLPIVTKDVGGDRVSIYNEATHPKFPLLGLHFHNTTGMHLNQGPITVYEGSVYAGDARILDLQKDEKRLLSYAIDLGTEVHAVPHAANGKITSIKVVKGIIHTTTRLQEAKTYTIANRSDTSRVVLIEHPNRTDFTLTTKEKPWETARDFHRFKVNVEPGKSVKYDVSEERLISSSVAISNSDDHAIRLLVNEQAITPRVKKALEEAVGFRTKLATTQREIQQLERAIQVIVQDQDRLRKNLKELPQDAAAYKKYLKKFDDQEVEMDNLHRQLKQMQEAEHAQRKQYENFLVNLSVE